MADKVATCFDFTMNALSGFPNCLLRELLADHVPKALSESAELMIVVDAKRTARALYSRFLVLWAPE